MGHPVYLELEVPPSKERGGTIYEPGPKRGRNETPFTNLNVHKFTIVEKPFALK